jgi:hypothetical protein
MKRTLSRITCKTRQLRKALHTVRWIPPLLTLIVQIVHLWLRLNGK